MKTLKELFELVAVAVERNNFNSEDWFIDYSGHVNKISIRYYLCGWSKDSQSEQANFTLDSDGIQGAYWFIKTRM